MGVVELLTFAGWMIATPVVVGVWAWAQLRLQEKAEAWAQTHPRKERQ